MASGVSNEIEPTLIRGNLAVHSSENLGIGNGSIELEGTLYCDTIASYNNNTPITIFDTSFTPNNVTCVNISSGIASFTTPLSVSSGGTGIASLPAGRIPFGNNQSSVSSSPGLVYDSSTTTLTCTNQVISGSLSVTGATSLSPALSVASGGTGNSSVSSGNVLYGNGTAALAHSVAFNWNNTTETLSATNISATTLDVSTGGTFVGPVTVGTATAANHAINKGYVDSLSLGGVSAGVGLTKTGSVLSVNTTQSQIVSVGTLTSLTVSGILTSTNTTQASSTTTGAIITPGGMGVGKNLYVQETVYSTNGNFNGWLGATTISTWGAFDFSSGTGNTASFVPGNITSSYTVTLPPAPPLTDANLMYINANGTANFAPPAIASIFSTVNSVNKCKIWTGTASVTSGGTLTVFPTSTNIASGVAVFTTILYAAATATVNTTTLSATALAGLRSISADKRTIIFNVVLPAGGAAANNTSVMVFILGY